MSSKSLMICFKDKRRREDKQAAIKDSQLLINLALNNNRTACRLESLAGPDGELPDRIKNIEPRLLEHISNEIIDKAPNVTWGDIGEALLEMTKLSASLSRASR
jgi:hypothetical protein